MMLSYYDTQQGEQKLRGDPDSVAYLCQSADFHLHKQMILFYTWALEACEFTGRER